MEKRRLDKSIYRTQTSKHDFEGFALGKLMALCQAVPLVFSLSIFLVTKETDSKEH